MPRRSPSNWRNGPNLHKRIVLAYSGGLDTSVAIPWLTEKYGAQIIAVTIDLGQGRELNQIRERAISAGAIRCHVLDVREQFARDYILGRESNQQKAGQLSHAVVLHGDIATADGEFDIFQSITAADVQRVARAYFTTENRTVLTIMPTGAATTGAGR